MKRERILLAVAFLEGFTTLAFQMVALRKAVPYVGSSIILTSIVIGVILLALSAGYYAGGALTRNREEKSLLQRLQIYLLISALYYLLIVYPSFSRVLTNSLDVMGFVPTLFLFSIVFFAIPTFLASHTMPIITHVSQGTKGFAAGKILFISTIGSFLGSTVTTLVLFPHVGVYRTGILASFILIFCSLLVYIVGFDKKKENSTKEKQHHGVITKAYIIFLILFFGCAVAARPVVVGRFEDTPYQSINVLEGELRQEPGKQGRVMRLNGGEASGIYTNTKKSFFAYARAIVGLVEEVKPKSIAVIGAAGCTLPQEIAGFDFVDHIDVVDIDARVFPIAESVFLKESLNPKITPIVESARGRIYNMQQLQKKYDVIIVDVYNGVSLPEEVVTHEFFAGLKSISNDIIMNVITDKKLASPFAQSFLYTLQQVYGDTLYTYDASSTPADYPIGNTIVSTFQGKDFGQHSHIAPTVEFTDDKNIADSLRVDMMYKK